MECFRKEIYGWFLNNKRDLPWRKTSDPYKIWISEIILQQTRVVQGIDYYNRFIEEFPTVFDLAKASEDNVLKLWQGLGYYTRARNLHFTSKEIVKFYGGIFPDDYNVILSLKGIGQYTAAAIASIAFNQPFAAIDGNINRVVCRYFGILSPIDTKKGIAEIREIAEELISVKSPGNHNQAMMEFGALQCVPKSPDCSKCPVASSCFAFKNNMVDLIPVKLKKVKQSVRYFYYFVIDDGDSVLFEKRTGNDIWRNLYQFPLFEPAHELTDSEILNLKIPVLNHAEINIKSISETKKHALTHQTINARFIHVETAKTISHTNDIIRVNKKDIYKFAIPKLLENFLNNISI